MRRLLLLLLLLAGPALTQPLTLDGIKAEVDGVIRECDLLLSKPSNSKWPNGNPKEVYVKQPDGSLSYTKFYETGGFAVKCQRTASKAIVYERFFGNGKTSATLRKDERIADYTSYWESGDKKCKYQYNYHTKETFYQANDKTGKQVYPK